MQWLCFAASRATWLAPELPAAPTNPGCPLIPDIQDRFCVCHLEGGQGPYRAQGDVHADASIQPFTATAAQTLPEMRALLDPCWWFLCLERYRRSAVAFSVCHLRLHSRWAGPSLCVAWLVPFPADICQQCQHRRRQTLPTQQRMFPAPVAGRPTSSVREGITIWHMHQAVRGVKSFLIFVGQPRMALCQDGPPWTSKTAHAAMPTKICFQSRDCCIVLEGADMECMLCWIVRSTVWCGSQKKSHKMGPQRESVGKNARK